MYLYTNRHYFNPVKKNNLMYNYISWYYNNFLQNYTKELIKNYFSFFEGGKYFLALIYVKNNTIMKICK